MTGVHRDVWENSKAGRGPCQGCPNAGGEYNHPGFFNPEADILVVEESPSRSHFDFPNYDRSRDNEWYRQYFEEVNRDIIASWPPIEDFLEPVFSGFEYSRDDVFDLVYMTSAVKCPSRDLADAYEHCQEYLDRELDEIDPEVVVTAGSKPTKWTAELLGVPPSESRKLRISKPNWWGKSNFSTEIPLIHVPHWGYYTTHHRLSDQEWNRVIESVQDGLEEVGFS